MRVLELGSYLAPAVAGTLLAEQGARVEKWTWGVDPLLGLRTGQQLWDFYTEGKTVRTVRSQTIGLMVNDAAPGRRTDVVIDNHLPETWAKWGISPREQAGRLGVVWVSIVPDVPGRSFDVIAQARALGDLASPVPFYLGDTAAGAIAAMVASTRLCTSGPGWYVVPQAAALGKLREGELRARRPDGGWDEPGTFDLDDAGARVVYRGETITEPLRDRTWQLAHLAHMGGRLAVGVDTR